MKLADIVIATANKHKAAELKAAGAAYDLALKAQDEVQALRSLPPPPEVEEPFDTYLLNAEAKARAISLWSGLPAIGDDSGLEVDALSGRPGVFSQRYAGASANDSDRIQKLLGELEAAEQLNPGIKRTARFRSVIVLSLPSGEEYSAEGVLEGEILRAPQGTAGFGYDPIVFITEFGKTLAETEFSETCARGFRRKAFDNLMRVLGNT